MKKYLLFILLILTSTAYGQRNFREGYIVRQAGDTTYGQVSLRNNRSLLSITHFRKDSRANIQSFGPNDLIGFGYVGDKYMESKNFGFVDGNVYKVFLETLFKGRINLYRYKNGYIVEKENLLHLLIPKEQDELTIEEKLLIYSEKNVRTIARLIADCGEIVMNESDLRIADRHLVETLKRYHQCRNEGYEVFKEVKPWTRIGFGLMAGFNSSKIKFETNQPNDFLAEANFEHARSLFMGLEINIASPRVNEGFEVVTGLQLMKTDYYGLSEIQGQNGILRSDIWISLEKFTIPLGVRISFSGNKLVPYLGFGSNFTTNTSFSFDRITEIVDNGLIIGLDNSQPFFEKKQQVGLWAVFGMSAKLNKSMKGFFEVKIEKTNGVVKTAILQNARLNDSISNMQLLFGLRF